MQVYLDNMNKKNGYKEEGKGKGEDDGKSYKITNNEITYSIEP